MSGSGYRCWARHVFNPQADLAAVESQLADMPLDFAIAIRLPLYSRETVLTEEHAGL